MEGQEWGWDGIDRRAMLQGSMYNGPTFTNDWSPNVNSFSEIFLHCFPCYFIEVDMVEATNNALLAVNAVRTTFGELLRYIGMMLLMLCYMKSPDYFWRMAVRTGDCSEDEENDSCSRSTSTCRVGVMRPSHWLCGLQSDHRQRSEINFGRFGI